MPECEVDVRARFCSVKASRLNDQQGVRDSCSTPHVNNGAQRGSPWAMQSILNHVQVIGMEFSGQVVSQ